MPLPDNTALLVIDVQQAFDDPAYWPPNQGDNPDCEQNVAALIAAWRDRGQPVVFVRHDSVEEGSPLRPGTPGNALKAELTGEPELLITKQVHSAFHGEPDLHAWLGDRGLRSIAVCGIQTNHCVETTARVGADLGYEVLFVIDACRAYGRTGPDGGFVTAQELTRASVASLHGEFATVVTTAAVAGPPSALAGARAQ